MSIAVFRRESIGQALIMMSWRMKASGVSAAYFRSSLGKVEYKVEYKVEDKVEDKIEADGIASMNTAALCIYARLHSSQIPWSWRFDVR